MKIQREREQLAIAQHASLVNFLHQLHNPSAEATKPTGSRPPK
jgi:hypothetical protein